MTSSCSSTRRGAITITASSRSTRSTPVGICCSRSRIATAARQTMVGKFPASRRRFTLTARSTIQATLTKAGRWKSPSPGRYWVSYPSNRRRRGTGTSGASISRASNGVMRSSMGNIARCRDVTRTTGSGRRKAWWTCIGRRPGAMCSFRRRRRVEASSNRTRLGLRSICCTRFITPRGVFTMSTSATHSRWPNWDLAH